MPPWQQVDLQVSGTNSQGTDCVAVPNATKNKSIGWAPEQAIQSHRLENA